MEQVTDVLEKRAKWALINGDAAASLSLLPDSSIDALVTDPPAGIGLMGKDWDGAKGGRDPWIAWLAGIMRECLRVMKPGAHGLVWALPRTSHWTATALENAGFEVRDIHHHIFGTGFPKSLDVSKAIDAALGAKRQQVGTAKGHTGPSVEAHAGVHDDDGYQWPGTYAITAPATAEAKQWAGWGTALKPAAEHWILIRKPLAAQTVAANVLEHNTGALNIDACRIDGGERPLRVHPYLTSGIYDGSLRESRASGETTLGRWPAHLSLDEEAAAMLDEQSGLGRARKASVQRHTATENLAMRGGNQARLVPIAADSGGGASRFFYVAKPSRAERDRGCEHLPTRSAGEAADREEGSPGLDNPRAGAGRTGGAKNFHPTVKSQALMRWLITLITPPGGVVLDCFAGSGSTLCAAVAGGWRVIGIEREAEYIGIASARASHAESETKGDLWNR